MYTSKLETKTFYTVELKQILLILTNSLTLSIFSVSPYTLLQFIRRSEHSHQAQIYSQTEMYRVSQKKLDWVFT